MFEQLKSAPLRDAENAEYEVGLRLGQPGRSQAIKEGYPIPLALDPLAVSVLEEIQRDAGKHLADLTEAETSRYLRSVYDLMDDRRRAVPSTLPPGRAEQLLAELRAEYGDPFPAGAFLEAAGFERRKGPAKTA